MKTRISVEILKQGTHNGEILNAIASHNSDVCILSPEDLISYANIKRAMYPTLYKGSFDIYRMDGQEDELALTEDGGKSNCLIIKFREIHELAQNEETDPDDHDDLKEVFLPHTESLKTGGGS